MGWAVNREGVFHSFVLISERNSIGNNGGDNESSCSISVWGGGSRPAPPLADRHVGTETCLSTSF